MEKKRLLISTGIIGSSQFFALLVHLVRAKLVAIILGPFGTGMLSTFQSTLNMLESLFSFGVHKAGVKTIAEVSNSDNPSELGILVVGLRSVLGLLAIFGTILTFLISGFLSRFSFNTIDYWFHFAIIGFGIFFKLIGNANTTVLQGMRDIKGLAKVTVYSNVLGTVASLPLIYFFGIRGLAFYLVVLSFCYFLISRLYYKRLDMNLVRLHFRDWVHKTGDTLKLGFSFMLAGFITLASTFVIKVVIIDFSGVESAGLYQAAVGLGLLYVNFILQAMGKDFFPALAKISFESKAENKLINDQIDIVLLLTVPGLLFTMGVSKWLIIIFYSEEYGSAGVLLSIILVGVFFKSLSWPFGYLLMARERKKKFVAIETTANLVLLLFTLFLIGPFGLRGVAFAYLGMYLVYFLVMSNISRAESGFRFNRKLLLQIIFHCLLICSFAAMSIVYSSIYLNILMVSFSIIIAFLNAKRLLEILSLDMSTLLNKLKR